MGLLLCARHGRQGIAFVCPHAARAVWQQTALPDLANARADYDGLRFQASLCAACAAAMAQDGAGLERAGEQGLEWFFGLKLEAVCPGCLAEVSQGTASAPRG
jgi:hypothetical protein